MTLHITYVSPQFVLQVSDRLVTLSSRGRLAPFDTAANKTVVYFARDAYVSIGYAGRAYLEGRPTDQWIADKLIGEEVNSRARSPGGGIPQRIIAGPLDPWHDIGTARQVLREALIKTTCRLPPDQRPKLIIGGWQRWKQRSRPVAYVIADDGSSPLYRKYGSTPRHEWLRGVFWLNFTPLNHQLRRLREELAERLEGLNTADEVEKRITESLRLAADTGPGIGKDYLAVLLPPPGQRQVRTRYVAFGEQTEESLLLHEDLPAHPDPVGYSPWIVAPSYQAGPAVMVGSQTINGPLGDFSLLMEGPPVPAGPVRRWAMGSQPRPPWPR